MSLSSLKRAFYIRRFYLTVSFYRHFSSAIPVKPIAIQSAPNTSPVRIDPETIQHLERLSLVDFANREGVKRLEEAIRFADQIHSIDTTSVEPLISVLNAEGISCPAREDKVTETDQRELILSNAAVTQEEYFYAPPGNIPLPEKQNSY